MITLDSLCAVVSEVAPTEIASLDEATDYVPQLKLDYIVSEAKRNEIYSSSPDEFNGVSLRYQNGTPVVRTEMSIDAIITAKPEDFVLPDGREIKFSAGYYGLVGLSEEKQRSERAIETRVRQALVSLQMGVDVDKAVEEFGGAATMIAQERYRVVLEEIEDKRIAAQREEERRQAMLKQIDELLEANDDMYERTRPAGLEDCPDEIIDAFEDISLDLDGMKGNLQYIQARIHRGYQFERDEHLARIEELDQRLRAVEKRLALWRKEQEARDSQPVSDDDLLALMGKFNRR